MKRLITFFMLVILIINGLAFYVFNKKIDIISMRLESNQMQIINCLRSENRKVTVFYDAGKEE